MDILIIVLSTVVFINALLLIGLILIQQSKGGGFGSAFGGTGQDIFGAHATSHLTKLTVIFAAIFFLLTLTLAIITGRRAGTKSAVEIEEMIENPDDEKGGNVQKDAPGTVTKQVPGGTIKMTPVDKPGTVTKQVPGGTIKMTPVDKPGTVTKQVPGGTIKMTPVDKPSTVTKQVPGGTIRMTPTSKTGQKVPANKTPDTKN